MRSSISELLPAFRSGREQSRLLLVAVMALLAMLFASGASPAIGNAPASAGGVAQYQLDAGDEVRVTVFGIDAMNGTHVVADDGTITLPMAGQVTARGASTTQLQNTVAGILRDRQILLDPNVSIQLVKGRPFYVLGEVKKPGEYEYRPGMRVLTAVAAAGGFTFRANQKKILVTRVIDGRSVTGTVSHDTQILPGDMINVQESWF